MKNKITLYYFNVKGRCEPIRYLLAYANVDYTDRRFSQEEWPQAKLQMPTAKVPMLDVDGLQITQSSAILIYLANEHGLTGKGSQEIAKLAEADGMANDIFLLFLPWTCELDPAKKEKLGEDLRTRTLPEGLNAMTHIAKLDQGNKFILGDKPSWADFKVAGITEFIIDNYPEGNLQKLHQPLVQHLERVQALPGVKEYIASRPQTQTERSLTENALRSQQKKQ